MIKLQLSLYKAVFLDLFCVATTVNIERAVHFNKPVDSKLYVQTIYMILIVSDGRNRDKNLSL